MDNQSILIFASVLAVLIFIILRFYKNSGILGKRGKDGSDIKKSKFQKYKSIRDVPKLQVFLGKKIIVAYFNHAQCAGCKELTPKFQQLNEEKEFDNIAFISINPNKDNIDFMSIGVMFVPTILIFDLDGDLSKNVVGLIEGSADKVINEVKNSIANLS